MIDMQYRVLEYRMAVDDLSEVPLTDKCAGATVICKGDVYVWFDGKWECLRSDGEDRESQNNTLPTNCKNCGAPLHGHECEYCGTRY